jgi:outer membrane protein
MFKKKIAENKRYGMICSKSRISAIFLVIIFLTTSIGFAEVENVKILTLNKAIEIALRNNIGLKQAVNQVKSKNSNLKKAKMNRLPDIRLSASIRRNFNKMFDATSNSFESSNSKDFNLNISMSKDIFNGFRDKASRKKAKYELKSVKKDCLRSQQSVIFETLQRYIQVVISKELIKVEKENLEAQKLQLLRIEDFFKAGKRSITDLYQQKAEISASQYELLNSEKNFNVNKLLLMKTLGLEPDTVYQVIDPAVERINMEFIDIDNKDLIVKAKSMRPDIKALEMEIKALREGVKISKSGYWPILSSFADISTNYSNINEQWGFSTQIFDNNPNARVGLTLSMPLFDKGVTRNSVALSKINLKNMELELKRLNHNVSVELGEAEESYRSSLKQVQVAESQLKYSKAALTSIEDRYSVNASTITELSQIRSQYLKSKFNQIEAKFNLFIKGIAVMFYMGDSESILSILK